MKHRAIHVCSTVLHGDRCYVRLFEEITIETTLLDRTYCLPRPTAAGMESQFEASMSCRRPLVVLLIEIRSNRRGIGEAAKM